jgi:hypothetical protein
VNHVYAAVGIIAKVGSMELADGTRQCGSEEDLNKRMRSQTLLNLYACFSRYSSLAD